AFSAEEQTKLLAPDALAAAGDAYAGSMNAWENAHGDLLHRLLDADIHSYLIELLMKQDQMSMAASVESRVPFLDHQLVEHVVRMPVEFKVRGIATKVVLREALRKRIPREILRRRKLGFPVPLGRWARERYAPLIRETILGPRAL